MSDEIPAVIAARVAADLLLDEDFMECFKCHGLITNPDDARIDAVSINGGKPFNAWVHAAHFKA